MNNTGEVQARPSQPLLHAVREMVCVSSKLGIVLLAGTHFCVAGDPNARTLYCAQAEGGQWSLHRFKPLIQVHGGTVFAEMMFEGTMLDEVRLRRFYADSELRFDYTFDRYGRLVGLHGSVTVRSVPPPGVDAGQAIELADWVGEADLLPGSDGRIPAHHILYTREKDRIDKPEGAEKYVSRFDDAPVYRTTQAVPCGAMMKEAEAMNATQE